MTSLPSGSLKAKDGSSSPASIVVWVLKEAWEVALAALMGWTNWAGALVWKLS